MYSVDGLLHFHEMAHEGLGRMLAHVATLPQDKLSTKLDSFGPWLASVRTQLVHIYAVEEEWVSAVQGQTAPEGAWKGTGLETAQDFMARAKEVQAKTRVWLSSENEASLNSPRQVAMDGDTKEGIPAELLLHLMTHAYHHKGQVAVMCRMLGHPAPDTDMIWIDFQRPSAESPKTE